MSAPRRSEEDVVRLGTGDDLRSYIDTLAGHGPQHETVVEVDRDDDLTSVRSKLEGTRLPRVVLVIPGNVKALRDGLAFRVLRRLQRELGLDLIIVSDDLSRRGFARENGFRTVHASLRAYYGSVIPTPDRSDNLAFTDPEEFSPSIGISRWGVLVGAILLTVLVAVAYLAVPVAQVVVYPETQSMVRDVEVLVEVGGPRLDFTAQRLSGRVIQARVQLNGSVDVKSVPSQPAPGGNVTAFQPGSVTLEVRDALRQQMLQQANDQAMGQLRGQLKSNESMPDQAMQTQIVSERYDRNIGEAAEQLGGTLEILATGLAYNNDDFNRLVLSLWSQDIPRDFRAVGNPKLDPPGVVNAEGQHMALRVRAYGLLQRDLDTGAIATAVRGKSPSEAEKSLAALAGLARPPEVVFWPDWAGQAFRVQVKTQAEPPSSARSSPSRGGQ
ncbi:MAG: hypothetical protein ACYC66_07900 [Chloroflexota bacterium]